MMPIDAFHPPPSVENELDNSWVCLQSATSSQIPDCVSCPESLNRPIHDHSPLPERGFTRPHAITKRPLQQHESDEEKKNKRSEVCDIIL